LTPVKYILINATKIILRSKCRNNIFDLAGTYSSVNGSSGDGASQSNNNNISNTCDHKNKRELLKQLHQTHVMIFVHRQRQLFIPYTHVQYYNRI